MTHLIRIGTRYFSARRGYCGGRVGRGEATRFTQADATERAARIAGATVEAI